MTNSAETAQLLESTVRTAMPVRGPKHLHPGQWAVLRYLAQADFQTSTVRHVASDLAITQAPASRAIASLVRKGLVLAMTDGADRRRTRLELTVKGKSSLAGDPIHRLTAAVESLDRCQQARLADTLTFLHGQLINRRTVEQSRD